MAHDPSAYGRSFADVYDQWYADAPVDEITAFLTARLSGCAHVLELGIGTGRIALPLATSGFRVSGVDASEEMVAHLRAKPGGDELDVTIADAADAAHFPRGPFDAVIAAFNLIFNLADRTAQSTCLANAAASLHPGGLLVLEAFVPAAMHEPTRDLVTRSVSEMGVVLIATETDPTRSVVHGAHIELTDDQVRVRPWRVCVATPDELDELATGAGFTLAERHGSWAGAPFVVGDSAHHISVYRKGIH